MESFHWKPFEGLSDTETATLIMENCPCHFHCFNGCANCGTYECADSALIDPVTTPNIQPGASGAANPGKYGTRIISITHTV